MAWNDLLLIAHRTLQFGLEALARFWFLWVPIGVSIAAVLGLGLALRWRREREARRLRAQGVIAVDEQQAFVLLLQSCRHDADFRQELLGVLRLGAFHRRSLIGRFLSILQTRGAPVELSQALALLRDDRVAARARTLLEGMEPAGRRSGG